MYKKFEVNRTKIKGGCQSYTKAAPWESWSDFTLVCTYFFFLKQLLRYLNYKYCIYRCLGLEFKIFSGISCITVILKMGFGLRFYLKILGNFLISYLPPNEKMF